MILAEFVPSKWLHIGLVLFFNVFIDLVFIGLDSVSVHKHAKNRISPDPAIFTGQAWSIVDISFD